MLPFFFTLCKVTPVIDSRNEDSFLDHMKPYYLAELDGNSSLPTREFGEN